MLEGWLVHLDRAWEPHRSFLAGSLVLAPEILHGVGWTEQWSEKVAVSGEEQ